MKKTIKWYVLAAVLTVVAGWAWAADQTILGRSFIVKNTGTPDKRRVTSVAKEKDSPNTIVGNPTLAGSAGGAVLTVIANGANPTSQVFNLPQGSTASGKDFWKASGSGLGYKYKDSKGDQGPVKSVTLRRTSGGIFTIKAVIRAKNGAVNVVPPDPGTDGFVTLQIGGGGDRYCVQFGSDGTVVNKGAELFKVRRPTLEGCPGPYSSPSRAFLDAPADLLD